ncbi:cation-transporting P-type ATPase [Balneolaceae bacterium YR4-1]|uniref:Cation-transporting P-type ATPase n=1 Tax=Halalkalibaculum roseum TaxID=2709311 RepID=A0A6M1T1D4_9BACT|nr:cation-transporting P-type ATPase [Halalkalibaculum roseum]
MSTKEDTTDTVKEQTASAESLKQPWALPIEEVVDGLEVRPEKGLKKDQVQKRLDTYGYNKLRQHRKKSLWAILWDQLKSLIILLLVVAAVVSFLYREIIEAWAIIAVIIINTAIGFFTEIRAVRSMEALLEMGKVKTRVRRNGEIREIDAEGLVPGDIVVVEAGDIITADIRITESSKLQADESALTGESMPVTKDTEPLADETILAERRNMLYKGTAITRGSGEGVVVSTGLNTELGGISSLVEEAESEQTPLEERLDKLGYRLIALTLLVAVFVTLSGIISGKEIYLMIEVGIALAVAAIPEGLPVVATIALARGMKLMAERNALINRLSSVETLGTTGIIFSDKTGTLTENRMTVTHFLFRDREIELESEGDKPFREGAEAVDPIEDEQLRLALMTGALCNNASLTNNKSEEASGDPLEVALLRAARRAGLERSDLTSRYPEEREEAFDAEVKMMATWNKIGEGEHRIFVKGAPSEVWQHCRYVQTAGGKKEFDDEEKEYWRSVNNRMAENGLRIIGLAYRDTDSTKDDPYKDLIFIGLITLLDPPRTDVKPSIKKCQQAGIRVIMVTGDQKETARYIAKKVGLEDDHEAVVVHGSELPEEGDLVDSIDDDHSLNHANIFARISPGQKLDLIQLYQDKGEVVAMTGDGVNDAPALKKADIGIAMGQRGTQVAKEAAHMVLTDDKFSTIVSAIEQGRIIFGNIKRFIFYLLSCNVSEVLIVGLATIAGAPLPLLPLQILFLNLVTDVFPALALGVGKGEEGVMNRPPREADEPILINKDWLGIGGYGLLITAAVLGVLFYALAHPELNQREAVTMSFLTLAFAQLWHVFNMRTDGSGIFDNTITRNPFVWGALALCVVLILSALYIPMLAEILQVVPPNLIEWMIVLGMSITPVIIGQSIKWLWHRS